MYFFLVKDLSGGAITGWTDVLYEDGGSRKGNEE